MQLKMSSMKFNICQIKRVRDSHRHDLSSKFIGLIFISENPVFESDLKVPQHCNSDSFCAITSWRVFLTAISPLHPLSVDVKQQSATILQWRW